MIHVRHTAVAAVPVDVAFDYIDNYRNVPTWMFGVSEFTPVSYTHLTLPTILRV